jgi:RNA polymerase sigma factor (sigma-70 family)
MRNCLSSLLKTEPLPIDEERGLGQIIKAGGSHEDVRRAVSKLVESNLRLVVWVARKYMDGPVACTLDELVSEGYARLLVSGGTYDVDRSKFNTWAVAVLRREFAKMVGFMTGAPNSERWWRRVSMSSQLDEEGDTYGSAAVTFDPEPIELPEKALATLSDRQRDVLDRHYGLRGRQEQTLREIGRDLGVTHQGVDMAERTAIAKLRQAESIEPASPPARRQKEAAIARRRQVKARWHHWNRQTDISVPQGRVAPVNH